MSRISPFQREKLEYYFNFFDVNGDHYIEPTDLPEFMKKILDYTGWKENSQDAKDCYEIHATFFEILKEKTQCEKLRVSKTEWLSLWNSLLPECMGMYHFPVWLRLLPKSLFKIIDKKSKFPALPDVSDDGVIDVDELAEFYHKIVHIKPDEAKVLAKTAYNDMTDYGRYPLNLLGYEQIFANFLLGRTPYGPGRFIFGCFESSLKDKHFKLIQPAVESETEESVSESEEEPPVPPMTKDGRATFY